MAGGRVRAGLMPAALLLCLLAAHLFCAGAGRARHAQLCEAVGRAGPRAGLGGGALVNQAPDLARRARALAGAPRSATCRAAGVTPAPARRQGRRAGCCRTAAALARRATRAGDGTDAKAPGRRPAASACPCVGPAATLGPRAAPATMLMTAATRRAPRLPTRLPATARRAGAARARRQPRGRLCAGVAVLQRAAARALHSQLHAKLPRGLGDAARRAAARHHRAALGARRARRPAPPRPAAAGLAGASAAPPSTCGRGLQGRAPPHPRRWTSRPHTPMRAARASRTRPPQKPRRPSPRRVRCRRCSPRGRLPRAARRRRRPAGQRAARGPAGRTRTRTRARTRRSRRRAR